MSLSVFLTNRSVWRIARFYLFYWLGLLAILWLVGQCEAHYGSSPWQGYLFLFLTLATFAAIGLLCHTANLNQYYVAGRNVPAVFNGMATAADWMSAASFIGLAGTLYANGYDGLAYIMGWTGGYCLVAFFLAPYIRKAQTLTIADFLAQRFIRNGVPYQPVRIIAVIATVMCSFIYLVAQIQGVGLITTRFIGVEFGVGVFFGLAGILVCSFLGGMRAVTWTQVAQYLILLTAYLLPLGMLSMKHEGHPIAQISYSHVLQQVTEREDEINATPAEGEVRQFFLHEAARKKALIDHLPETYHTEKEKLLTQLRDLRTERAPLRTVKHIEKQLEQYPKDVTQAYIQWQKEYNELQKRSQPIVPMAEPFPAADETQYQHKRLNFIALLFCLLLGSAGLPHILTRFQTTNSVSATRRSVAWTLFFIALIYTAVPAMAVLIKFEIYQHLVGISFNDLPAWVGQWSKLDTRALSISDINGDNIVQFAELNLHPDMLVLALPEIAGLPYVISGLVAAGALAAALSTADGLLLTVANTLSHDIYFGVRHRQASHLRRVTASKILLLAIAIVAAYVSTLRLGNILFLVGAAFSMAASGFVPALIISIFWKRTTGKGVLWGMLVGLSVCLFYIMATYPPMTQFTGWRMASWWGIEPISSGCFGVPAGCITIILISLFDKRPDAMCTNWVQQIRQGDNAQS